MLAAWGILLCLIVVAVKTYALFQDMQTGFATSI